MTDAPRRAPGAVGFGSAQRMLSLFAQGLAGRPLNLQPQTMHALDSTVGRSGRLISDGITLNVPDEIADFDNADDNLGAYRIAVLHQLGLVTDGAADFDFRVAAARLGLPEPTFGWRPEPPSELERFYATARRPVMLRRVFAIVEDWRIDCALPRRYPGAQRDLQRVWAHALAARPALGGLRPLAQAFEVLLQHTIGAPRSTLPADGRVTALLATLAAVEASGASVYDSAAAALALYPQLEAMALRPLRWSTVAPTVEAPDGLAPDSAAGTGGDTDGADRLIDEDFDGPGVAFRGNGLQGITPRKRPGGSPGVTGDLPPDAKRVDGTARDVESDRPTVTSTRQHPAGARLAADGPRTFFYDEWDCHRQTYLDAWCRVYEQRLRGTEVDFIHDVRRRHALLARQIERGFAFIRPEEWQRVHRTDDGDELELDAVIDAVIDRRRGHANDEGLYVRRDRARRDVAALFLMDMSASTDFAVTDPSAVIQSASSTNVVDDDDAPIFYAAPADRQPPPSIPKRRVIDVAKDALALMVDALHALGDACAVYGFSGEGRERVELYVAKQFTDPTDARTWAALAAMQPRGSTRMGPAVRHAAAALARHGARTQVLIVVSDGYPQDRDYGPDWRDTGYGIEDTACALREAERAGIATFCITIDPAGHDYLRRMCAEHRYLVIDDVHTLPAELSKVYRGLTGSR